MKRNLIVIVLACVLIVGTMLLGNVIIIGDKLGSLTHVYVEYTFYLLLLMLAVLFILSPIIKVHRAPEIPVLSADVPRDLQQLTRFARNLARHCDYIQDVDKRKAHQQQLMQGMKMHASDEDALRKLIADEVALRMNGSKDMQVLGVNKRIKEWGKTVFMVTAISQNSKFDTISVLVMNYRMIADIVAAAGFRPTKPQMAKLYIRVLTTALVTYCASQVFGDVDGVAPFDWADASDNVSDVLTNPIDEADLSDVTDVDVDGGGFGNAFMENLQKLQIPGLLVGSAMDGCVNALMTLRIGYVTRAYLTEGAQALAGVKNKRRIKRQAMKDSFKAMPAVLSQGGVAVGKTTLNLLKKAFVFAD